jgi:hypothetical protein
MMMHDLVDKLIPSGVKPDDVWTNFPIFIPGVHWLNSDALKERILEMKRNEERDKVILFDEVGQAFTARGWKKQEQTDLVTFAWQMPKCGIVLLFSDNVGNSADIILRDAAWLTIMPKFVACSNREGDYIVNTIVFNYDLKLVRGLIVRNVARLQSLFDSDKPVK